jgi:pSer/pThr/pTyr-binding forkhead associated (FHA) protein
MPTLVGNINGNVLRFRLKGVALIGRDKACDVILAGDKLSSRKNTKVYSDGRRYLVEDLQSRNGTFLNGVRLRDTQMLHDGDELRIGSVTIVFEDENSKTARPRPSKRSVLGAVSASDEAAKAFLTFFYALLLILIFGTTTVLSKLLFVMLLRGS